MYDWIVPIGYSVGGQLARIALGLLKSWKAGDKLDIKYTIKTIVESVVVGFIASFFTTDTNLLFTLGFAGTDVVESLVEIASKG